MPYWLRCQSAHRTAAPAGCGSCRATRSARAHIFRRPQAGPGRRSSQRKGGPAAAGAITQGRWPGECYCWLFRARESKKCNVSCVAPDLGSCTRDFCGCSSWGPDFLFPRTPGRAGRTLRPKDAEPPGEFFSHHDLPFMTGHRAGHLVTDKGARHGRHRMGRSRAGRRPDRQYADPRQEITGPGDALHAGHRRSAAWQLGDHPAARVPPGHRTAGPAWAPLRKARGTRAWPLCAARPYLPGSACRFRPLRQARYSRAWLGWRTVNCWESSGPCRGPARGAARHASCWSAVTATWCGRASSGTGAALSRPRT